MHPEGLKPAFATVFIALVFALTSGAAVAQTASTDSDPGNGRTCLQPGKAHVTLTDASGTTYLLQGSLGQASQSRQYVEVSGQELSPTSNADDAAMPRLNVKNLRKLADTCPENPTPPPSNPGYKATAPRQSTTTPAYDRPATAPAPEGAPVLNTQGEGGAPSPGDGEFPAATSKIGSYVCRGQMQGTFNSRLVPIQS